MSSLEEGLTEEEELEHMLPLICNGAMNIGNFGDLMNLTEIEASVRHRYPFFG